MCEAVQASGKFFIRKTKDGKYRLSLTLFDDGAISVERLQARQILLQSFLLDVHQGQDCLDVGRVCIRNNAQVQAAVVAFCSEEKAQEAVPAHKCVGCFAHYLQQVQQSDLQS